MNTNPFPQKARKRKAKTKRPTRPSYTVKQVEEALRQAGGIQAVAAAILGCHRNTIANKLRESPTLRAALEDIREDTVDLAESQLLKAIRDGHMTAIIFYLKTQAKSRGYVERAEVTGKDGGAIATTGVLRVPDRVTPDKWRETYSPAEDSPTKH